MPKHEGFLSTPIRYVDGHYGGSAPAVGRYAAGTDSGAFLSGDGSVTLPVHAITSPVRMSTRCRSTQVPSRSTLPMRFESPDVPELVADPKAFVHTVLPA